MNAESSNAPKARPRRRGWLWKLPLALVVLLVLLVVMLPTLVSWGWANGVARRAIESNVNGSVDLAAIRASWFGTQSIESLSITTPDGVKAVEVSATLNASLFDLALGRVTTFDVELTGSMEGELREDGSLSFAELVKSSPDGSPPQVPAPSTRSAIPGANISIAGVTVTLHNRATKETIKLSEVNGKATLEPGQSAHLELFGQSEANGQSGAFGFEATSAGAVSAFGDFTPSGASATAALVLRNIPVLFSSAPAVIHEFEINLKSDDLAKRVELSMNGKASAEHEDPSAITGQLVIDQLFDAAGNVTLALNGVTGSINGSRVPLAMLQPFLGSDSAVRIERDIGRTLELMVDFSAGEAKRVEVLAVAGERRLQLAGVISTVDRSFECDQLDWQWSIDPELAQALAGVSLDAPLHTRASFSRLSVPPMSPNGSLNLGAVAVDGTLAVERAVNITLAGESPRTVQIGGATVTLTSEAIGTLIRATGSALVDALTVEFDESISNLFDASGAVDFATLVPEGSVRIAGITDDSMAAYLPELAELVAANKVLPATAELRTQPSADGWNAELTLTGNKLDMLARASREGDSIRLQLENLAMRVSPALVAALQQDKDSPIELLGPVQVRLFSEPIELAASELASTDFAGIPLSVQGSFPEMALANVPAIEEPVLVSGFNAEMTMHLKPERSIRAVGETTLKLVNDGAALAGVQFDIGLADVNGAMSPTGMLELNDISLASLERAAGRAHGSISQWVGESGSVQLTLERVGETMHSNVHAELANVSGRFLASLSPELLTLEAETSRFVLPKSSLDAFLARAAPADVNGAGSAQRGASPQLASMRAVTDLPLNVNVRSLRIPVGVITKEPIDPSQMEIDLAIMGGPVSLEDPTLGLLSSESVTATVQTQNIAAGLAFEMQATARWSEGSRGAAQSAASEPIRLQVAGKVTNLLDAESRLATSAAVVDMNAEAVRIPTAIVDAAGNFTGLLVAALGSEVSARSTAEAFSLNTGKLTTRLDAVNGFMEGIVKGRDGMLQLSVNNPLRAELEITPELRDRLLYKIHPILADIRTTEQPLRVLVPNASVPVSGDVSKLNARIEITVGKVELDGGSTTLFLLKLFNAQSGTAIPGSIDPIIANIVNGVLTYEKFSLHIDKYRMNYSGTIDLNTGAVNLRTELPLEALAAGIKELRGYTDNIVVPIVTRGTFGNLKTQIDPGFDIAKEAIKGGLQGALGDLLGGDKKKDEGSSETPPKDEVGDLLDAILQGVGRKKNQSDAATQEQPAGSGTASSDQPARPASQTPRPRRQ